MVVGNFWADSIFRKTLVGTRKGPLKVAPAWFGPFRFEICKSDGGIGKATARAFV